MNGFTKVDNWLWDYVMPNARPNTFKVVSAVVRMTSGWHQENAVITFDDFQEMTGITNRGTLTSAIEDALSAGFIDRASEGRSYSYSLKIVPVDSPKIVLQEGLQSKNRTGEQSKNRTGNGLKIVPSTSGVKERKEKEEKDPIAFLAGHFTNETGILANGASWQDEWELPLGLLLKRAGTIEAACDLISRGVAFAREGGRKQYTLRSPLSITTIVANLPEGNGTGGTIKVGSR